MSGEEQTGLSNELMWMSKGLQQRARQPSTAHMRSHPSAAESSVLQRPSGASMAADVSMEMVAGSSVRRAAGQAGVQGAAT